MAYQARDVLTAMEADAGIALKELRADGGAIANDFMAQFQSDMLGVIEAGLRAIHIHNKAQSSEYPNCSPNSAANCE